MYVCVVFVCAVWCLYVAYIGGMCGMYSCVRARCCVVCRCGVWVCVIC